MTAPTFVTRGSALSLKSTPLPSLWSSRLGSCCSASITIERNFSILNRSPLSPTRSWRKMAGPGLSRRTRMVSTRNSGLSSTSSANDAIRSNARFAAYLLPSNEG